MKLSNNNTFWLSYVALILGLFFVFLLIFSAIFAKIWLFSDPSKIDAKNEQISLELNSKIENKDKEISHLKALLKEKEEQYLALENDFNASAKDSKKDIQSALSLKAVANFKIRLKDEANLDVKNGFITLDSTEFFEPGSVNFIKEKKPKLQKILSTYFDYFLSAEILPNIDKLVIEIHTDTSGEYVTHTKLAHKRAANLIEFISSFYSNKTLQKYLLVTAKAQLEPVLVDGVEDINASRRVVLGFSEKKE